MQGVHPKIITNILFATKARDVFFVNPDTRTPLYVPPKLYDCIIMDAPHNYGNTTYYGGLSYASLSFAQ